jgi:hypothetical protein
MVGASSPTKSVFLFREITFILKYVSLFDVTAASPLITNLNSAE